MTELGERVATLERAVADLQGQIDRRFDALIVDLSRRRQDVRDDIEEVSREVRANRRILVSLLVSISLAAIGIMLTALSAAGRL